jgi:hypothetical protein
MGQVISVDVKHSLGAEEAKQRVQAGIDALREKYSAQLSALQIDWTDLRGDVTVTAMGQTFKGAMEFFPEYVRVSLELPWVLAMIAEKAKSLMTKHTDDMLRLPPPKE